MLLNLYPEKIFDKGVIRFNIPVIHLDPKKDFEICLHQFYCKLTSASKELIRNSELWNLSTSLIDKCAINIDQSLSYFVIDNKSLVTYYKPTHLQFHQIQSYNIESAQFTLSPAFR